MSVIDLNTPVIESKIEELYGRESIELPDLERENLGKNDDSDLLLQNLEKEFPGYQFTYEFVEGTMQYKETPKLIYDTKERKYLFEIVRELNFEKNLPFQSLQLSIKFNFFTIIMKSLLLGTLIATLILIPFMILLSKNIVQPIIDISKGSRKIAEGSLGIQVNYQSKDEVGELVRSFNKMSKELSKIKKIRDDLLATISHELRSPLARISGYTELLLDLDFEKKDQDDYYRSILTEIDLLNKMAGEIIEISRLELNKETLFLERIDFGYFIEMLEDDLQILAKMKNVNIKYQYPYGLLCNIDVEKMKRVLTNVIQNSIKKKEKNIDLTVTNSDDYLEIVILDDGVGIKEEYLDVVFEKFYRIDKSRDRKTGGFGLGLAICKGIVKEHDGEIFFKLRDKGSELHIQLPLVIEKTRKNTAKVD
ncbi:MAG: HAMP domain-containing histidine kinase [Spirochaetes bacterium]|nr:HAMP domain-containing histidine kinase [Spirochaetota bacterium]